MLIFGLYTESICAFLSDTFILLLTKMHLSLYLLLLVHSSKNNNVAGHSQPKYRTNSHSGAQNKPQHPGLQDIAKQIGFATSPGGQEGWASWTNRGREFQN
ncbi:microfibril-associated glycoprotein 3 [Platysternon megacephalum]|uniref:Microfibril-associated glycoprotein 3 n=1 Tax=Platysternon megacephalum TaxID=55544 RepID=A0A4D9EWK5_9SAUR|nr:microfibril-associated glycoprotein 3 [Platysternon megacephalum]